MKKCKKCNIEKSFDDFYKDKYSKDGYKGSCKECNKIYNEENRDRRNEYLKEYNKSENRKEYMKKYREENSDIISTKRKLKYEENRERELYNQKVYYDKNKENINKRGREKYNLLENKKEFNKIKNDRSIKYRSEYYKNNKEKIIENQKNYYENNKEKICKYRENYKTTRNEKRRIIYRYKMDNDNLFSLSESIRSSIRNSFNLKNIIKKSKTEDILGCSFIDFKLYLEDKFEDWMTWENRGLYNGELNYGWDIDHIIPLSSAETEEDIIRLNHYTNLQPLCSYINRVIKRDNII